MTLPAGTESVSLNWGNVEYTLLVKMVNVQSVKHELALAEMLYCYGGAYLSSEL